MGRGGVFGSGLHRRGGERVPPEGQRPPERVRPAATVHRRGRGEARGEATWFPPSVRRVRWPEQRQRRRRRCRRILRSGSCGAQLRLLGAARAWRLRREPRSEPPLTPEPRPLAARARRPARAAGRGEAAAPPRRQRSRRGPERTPPSHPVPFPGQRQRRSSGGGGDGGRFRGGDRFRPGNRRGRRRSCRDNACGRLACWRPGVTAFDARQAPPNGPRHELPSLLLPSLKRADQLGYNLEEVAHHTKVGDLEDRRVAILVDGDDRLRGLHAGPVLDRAGNAQRDIQL